MTRKPTDTADFIAKVNEGVDKVRTIVDRIDPDKEINVDKARLALSDLEDTVDYLIAVFGEQQFV